MAQPRIIIFDLEIIPDLNAALKYWTKLCPPWGGSQTLKADVSSICSFGYKVLGEGKHAKIKNLWDFPEWEQDVNNDKPLCQFMYDTLSTADALIYHNGDRFDRKHLLTRLMINKIQFIPEIPTIDTKKIAKRHLFMVSNSLDHLTSHFSLRHKMDHGEGWDLWVKTHSRQKKAMKLMSQYCKQDIIATESLFMALRPLIKNIPNHNVFGPEYARGKHVCPSCGSTRLKSHGWRHTKTRSYRRYRCLDCQSYSRTDASDRMPR